MTSSTRQALWQKYHDIMPPGAGALFLIQIFAIISFSVLYSSLILYTTKVLHMSDAFAATITGIFFGLNNFIHLFSGYIGGRYYSYRSLFIISMIIETIGCALIAIPQSSFLLWGLAAILTGSGVNLTCIYNLLTQLFKPEDKNRETSFLLNYSGLNIGFFFSFIVAGYYELHQNYQTLFELSALGNIIAIFITLYNWKSLQDRGTRYSTLTISAKQKSRVIGLCAVGLFFLGLRFLLQYPALCTDIIIYTTLIMFAFMLYLATRQTNTMTRQKIIAYCILAIAAIIFWTLLLLGPIGLNLFTERNVDRHVLGSLLAPQWILNINNLMTVAAAPLITIGISHLRARGYNISLSLQFGIGLLIMGIAYVILPLGIHFANNHGYSNVGWVLSSYSLQSIADLFVSPVGYALVGQLAPMESRSIMMGTWLMFGGITGIMADYTSSVAIGAANTLDPLMTNASYSHMFGLVGWIAVIAGIIYLICTPLITRLTHEHLSSTY